MKTQTKRGQAAVEFLMTYGWALLIVMGALAVIYVAGFANPRIANSCTLGNGFSCDSFSVDDQGMLHVELSQGTGREVVITGLACGTNASVKTIAPVTIASGERRLITPQKGVNCSINNSGAFRGNILVVYRFTDSEFNNTVKGDLSYDVVLVNHDTPTPLPTPPCDTLCYTCAASHGDYSSCDLGFCELTACGGQSLAGAGCTGGNVCNAGACAAKADKGGDCSCNGMCLSGMCDLNKGKCVKCRTASDCGDANNCTTDACSDGACTNTNLACGASCGSGMVCNSTGACLANGTEGAPCTCAAQCLSKICGPSNTCVGCQQATDCDNKPCQLRSCVSNKCVYEIKACGSAGCSGSNACNGTSNMCTALLANNKACACNATCSSGWCYLGVCRESAICSFNGTITSMKDGTPLDWINVSIMRGTTRNCSNMTSASGVYQCSGMRPGTFNITANRWDWKMNWTLVSVGITADRCDRAHVDLALKPNPGFFYGYVFKEDGKTPIDGPTVYIASAGFACRTTGWTEKGYYVCGNLLPGKYNITAEAAGYQPKNVTATIVSDTGVLVNFTLKK